MNLAPTRLAAVALCALLVTTAPAAVACGGGDGESDGHTSTARAEACATTWGSLPQHLARTTVKQVTDVRAGRHRCYDRLVVDVGGKGRGRLGYYVAYVDRVVFDGSGRRVPLRGGARLQVVVNAPAYDVHADPTYTPDDQRELADVTGYQTFRQIAWAGTFEGQTSLGLGVRARLPVRAFVLTDADGGRRLVVDVAHSWE